MLSAVTTQPQTQLCDLQPIQTISLTSSVATTQGHLPYFLHCPSEKSHLISSLPTGKLSSTPQLAICMHTQKSAVCFISQHMVPDLYTTEQSQAEAESEVLWVEISIIWFSLPWTLMWWFPSRRGEIKTTHENSSGKAKNGRLGRGTHRDTGMQRGSR